MTVLCIDPVKSLLEFAEIAARCGHSVLVSDTQSGYTMPVAANQYSTINLVNLGDDELQHVIHEHNVQYAFSDTTEGFHLAERINRMIEGLTPSSDAHKPLFAGLSDKALLAEHLQKNAPELAFRDFQVVNSEQELNQLVANLPDNEMLVVRPNRSSDDGSACFVERGDSVPARILDYLNTAEQHSCIVHRLIPGDAYFINGFKTRDGHIQYDTWRCIYRIAKPFGYLHSVLETRFEDQKHAAVKAHIEKLLNAIGLESGPFHLEVILGDNSFKVIKAATRLAGAPFIYFYEKRGGISQLASCLQAVSDSAAEEQQKAAQETIKYSTDFSFYPPQNGTLNQLRFQQDLESLASFDGYLDFPEAGQKLEAKGGEVSPLTISLSNFDINCLEKDIEQCIEFQSQGVFELA
ncbi:hypothetical protein KIH87_15180 [Paraneptunicella aestuarii]|uniref:hypothetical protein n=1 Tax=Paraneptunicella aestuarii TaxID=2831148 RepID=UPI001E51C16A|nr:hypothetical protein [Paraneptunicella aestuarii]UAA38020.1 hypothetical protein KIH87_15180 [Paraneptunicella aestuarii]